MNRKSESLRSFAWLLTLACQLSACADHRPNKQLMNANTGDDDGGGGDHDAGPGLIAVSDAGGHVISSGATQLCSYEDADQLAIADSVQTSVLAAAATQRGFGLLFQREDGALFVQAVPETGAPPGAIAATTAADNAVAPALVANDTTFLLGYRVDKQLLVRSLMAGAAATPLALTTRLAVSASSGEPWALSAAGSGFVAVWMDAADKNLRLRTLSDDAAATGSPQPLAGIVARGSQSLQLAHLASDTFVVAWREPGAGGTANVFGEALDGALTATSQPSQLSKNPIADAAFGLSGRADSAGLFYPALDGNVRPALKLRRITDQAAPDGPVLNVANAPRIVSAGSIAAFGRGYALVYRERPSLGRDHGAVRIAFVNPFGAVVYDTELVQVDDSTSGNTTAVAASGSDAVLVSWTTTDLHGTHVRALRMACPGALILCGGTVQ